MTRLVCLPVDLLDNPEPSGSTIIVASCGHQTWIAPNGLRALEDGKVTAAICGDCASPQMRAVNNWSRELLKREGKE